jgi:hypothetical protein
VYFRRSATCTESHSGTYLDRVGGGVAPFAISLKPDLIRPIFANAATSLPAGVYGAFLDFSSLLERPRRRRVGPGLGASAARLNSRCMRSTMVASAILDLFRSAWPNRTPLIAQFASKRACGVSRRTITPTKSAQSGSAFLTASAIADCKRSLETELRLSGLVQRHTKTMPPTEFCSQHSLIAGNLGSEKEEDRHSFSRRAGLLSSRSDRSHSRLPRTTKVTPQLFDGGSWL